MADEAGGNTKSIGIGYSHANEAKLAGRRDLVEGKGFEVKEVRSGRSLEGKEKRKEVPSYPYLCTNTHARTVQKAINKQMKNLLKSIQIH